MVSLYINLNPLALLSAIVTFFYAVKTKRDFEQEEIR